MNKQGFSMGSLEQGFALPMVLIVLALLTVLSMGLSQTARHRMADVMQRQSVLQDELQLSNASQWVMYHLLTGVPDKRVMRSAHLILPLDGGLVEHAGVQIHIQDAAGLLGLAFDRNNVMRALLESYVDKQDAAAIADRLSDWVDADQRPHDHGMETGDYIKKRLPMLPRNAPIRSLDELLELPGITVAMFNGDGQKPGLRDVLLAGGAGYFNVATAPSILVGPVLGIKGNVLKDFLALRADAKWGRVRELLGRYVLPAYEVSLQPSFMYRLRLQLADGASARLMFRMTPFKRVPYERIVWHYPDHDRG